jgi:hypothetical protein
MSPKVVSPVRGTLDVGGWASLEIDGVETRIYRGLAHSMLEGQEVGGRARERQSEVKCVESAQ